MKSVGLILLLYLIPMLVLAQPGPPPDPDVPISGIEILLGGGALLGLKKIISRIKSRKE